MFVPSLGLLAFALHQRSQAEPTASPFDAPPAPERLSDAQDIAGWEASIEVRGMSRLAVRLEALHPDPARQAFDARALARALRPDLPQAEVVPGDAALGQPGAGVRDAAVDPAGVRGVGSGDLPAAAPLLEPWRLTLSAFPLSAFPLSARQHGDLQHGEPPAAERAGRDATVVDSLAAVHVQGLEPLVPRAFEPDAAAVFDEASDPRLALFAFPVAPLAVGESHDLVFWGRRPSRDRPVRVRIPGVTDELDLTPRIRAGRRATQSIAYWEAATESNPKPTAGAPR